MLSHVCFPAAAVLALRAVSLLSVGLPAPAMLAVVQVDPVPSLNYASFGSAGLGFAGQHGLARLSCAILSLGSFSFLLSVFLA